MTLGKVFWTPERGTICYARTTRKPQDDFVKVGEHSVYRPSNDPPFNSLIFRYLGQDEFHVVLEVAYGSSAIAPWVVPKELVTLHPVGPEITEALGLQTHIEPKFAGRRGYFDPETWRRPCEEADQEQESSTSFDINPFMSQIFRFRKGN